MDRFSQGIFYDYTEGLTGVAVTAGHGLGCNHTVLKPQLDPFQSEARPTIAVDFRGHGRSRRYDGISIENDAGDLCRILDDNGIESTDYIGFSRGCLVGLEFAHRYPDRLQRMALLAPGMIGDSFLTTLYGAVYRLLLKPLAGLAKLDQIPRPDINLADGPENIVAATALRLLSTTGKGFYGALESAVDYGVPKFLSEINHPTLLVQAKQDELISHTAAEYLVGHLPKAKFVSVQGGHVFMGSKREELAELLKEHFN
ncbi:alpha/beta hydrolase [Candidatus Woesearchaeota archaeon]|nr:alpha/beta hydrolase [Candidatus Woesearchaeota archaeon]